MNALELAEKLENDICPSSEKSLRLILQAATMLRQQQAEKEALEDKLHNVIIRSSKQIAEFENQVEVLRGMIVNRDEIIDRLDLK